MIHDIHGRKPSFQRLFPSRRINLVSTWKFRSKVRCKGSQLKPGGEIKFGWNRHQNTIQSINQSIKQTVNQSIKCQPNSQSNDEMSTKHSIKRSIVNQSRLPRCSSQHSPQAIDSILLPVVLGTFFQQLVQLIVFVETLLSKFVVYLVV